MLQPNRCYYYLTYRCNSRCKYCNIWQSETDERESSIETIKDHITQLKGMGIQFIDFTGGEPFLKAGFPEILKHAKAVGFPTVFATSGILYAEYAKSIRGVVDCINFSLDTLNHMKYRQRRGVDDLDKVLMGIETAQHLGQKMSLLVTVDEENIDELDDLYAFAKKIRCEMNINPVFSYFKNERFTAQSINRLLDFAHHNSVYVNQGQISLILDGGNKTKAPRCRAISRNTIISPNGYLLLPCYHKAIKRVPIDGSIADAYNSEAVREIQPQEGGYPFCEGCTINCYMDTANLRVGEYIPQ